MNERRRIEVSKGWKRFTKAEKPEKSEPNLALVDVRVLLLLGHRLQLRICVGEHLREREAPPLQNTVYFLFFEF